jgi:hypothetical protein
MSSLADDLKKAPQPNRPNAPRGSSGVQSVSNGLARHQQFEGMALDLAAHSDQRLSSLGGALIAQRQQQVNRFANLLEQIQDGTVDLTLLGEELAQRAEKRQQAEAVFTVDTKGFEVRDFQVKPDQIQSLTGKTFLKALEGI